MDIAVVFIALETIKLIAIRIPLEFNYEVRESVD